MLDDKSGDAATGAFLRVCHSHQDGESGLGNPAHPDLSAIDYPVIPITHSSRGHVRGVRAGTGFGYRYRRDGFTTSIGLEVLHPLLFVDCGEKHVKIRGVRREGKRRYRAPHRLVDPNHGECR